jgi:hypothetical protein
VLRELTWITLSCKPALIPSSPCSTDSTKLGCLFFGMSVSDTEKKLIRHFIVDVTMAEDPANPTWNPQQGGRRQGHMPDTNRST